jgi:DNA-binding NarL/FixJ family response regulator
MTVWIPQELRDWVAGNAAKQDESLGEVVTKILANAQRQQQQPEPESLPVTDTETVDMFLVPEDQTAKAEPNTPTFESTAERDARILELHQQKMAKRAIGRALGISESTVRRVIQKFEVSA